MVAKKILLMSLFVSMGIAGCTEIDTPTEEQGAEAPATEINDNTAVEEQTPEELFEQVQNNSPTQDRLDALVDIAMYYYWYGGDLKVAEKNFSKGSHSTAITMW